MNPALLTEADLKEFAGRERRAALRKWLDEQHVDYWLNGKGEVVSTVQALNRALTGDDHIDAAAFSFVCDEGVQVIRGKGSRPGLVEWSERLKAWNARCQSHNRDRATPWQIRMSNGNRVGKSTRDKMWSRTWQKLRRQHRDGEIDYLPEYFTMHDLKAKAITDGSVKDTHKSPKMLDVYDRALRREKPTR